MWKYWNWNEISRKYVKHYSRILFLFSIIFLMMSIPSKESFNTLNVYNFTSKRPELVLVYQTIINIDGVGNYTVSDVELEF